MPTLPGLNVSRETQERLAIYQDLVEKWTPKINLVASGTLSEIWERHFIDSAQLFRLTPAGGHHWVDLGSGAGFPGLVIAILAQDTGLPNKITLVESDMRKAVFLRTVLRQTDIQAEVLNDRIEHIAPLNADVISARALADLTSLLGYAAQHLSGDGTAIFPKGEKWRKELKEAQSKWCFDHKIDTSITHPCSVVIRVKGVRLV